MRPELPPELPISVTREPPRSAERTQPYGLQCRERLRRFWQDHPVLRKALVVLLLTLSVAILFAQVYRGRELLQAYDWQIDWGAAGMALAWYTLAICIAAWVWAGMMNALGTNLAFGAHFRYLCLTNLAKRLPGSIWYVVGRSQFYARHGIPAETTSVASGMELGISAVAGVLVNLVFSVPIMVRYQLSPWLFVAVFIIGLVLIQPATVAWLLNRLGVPAQRLSYRRLITWVGAHGVIWVVGGCMLFSIANIVAEVHPRHLFFVIGSWSLVGVLSMLMFFWPSNFGLTEVGLSLLLSSVLPGPIAVIIALCVRLIMIVFELIWAFTALALSAWQGRLPWLHRSAG